MIDQSHRVTTDLPSGEPPRLHLPVSPALGRRLVLLGVFACAACGLVYELALVALAAYLVGDSVTQASVVLSVMVFAMGIGSLLAKRWYARAAAAFGVVEVALAVVGGLSTFLLYGCFAWFGQARATMAGVSCVIGLLVGAEIPLLMMLISRIRRRAPGEDVADLFAADYVGALVGGLAFPFLLLPVLGQLEAVLLAGTVNALAGSAMVLWLFRADLTGRQRGWLCTANVAVLALLGLAAVLAGSFEHAARQAIYGAAVRRSVLTADGEVVLTGNEPETLRLFVDGQLRVLGADAHRYHEALVHPAMAGPHRRVLLLGGGDGLALREVLRYPTVRRVTVVDPTPGLVSLARTDPVLTSLNGHAHRDPRVRTESRDVFRWLRGSARRAGYDVVLADLPEPGISRASKLYSQEFYGLLRRALAPRGRFALYAGSPEQQPRSFWTVSATVRAAGLHTVEYRVDAHPRASHRGSWLTTRGRSDWGFVLAGRHRPALRLDPRAPRLRSLDAAALREAGRRVGPGPEHPRPPSTLMHPRYLGATTP